MTRSDFPIDRFVAFATIGIVGVTQELVQAAREGLPGMDAGLVAEETLCLAVQVTLCAADASIQPYAGRASDLLRDVPALYHDYALGALAVATADASLLQESAAFRTRLERRQMFYAAHLPQGRLPSREQLCEKMELWMGRISPSGLSDLPAGRLRGMNGAATMHAHMRLVQAFGRQLLRTG